MVHDKAYCSRIRWSINVPLRSVCIRIDSISKYTRKLLSLDKSRGMIVVFGPIEGDIVFGIWIVVSGKCKGRIKEENKYNLEDLRCEV